MGFDFITKRFNIAIPHSVLKVIDRVVLMRVEDGESSVTRTSVAVDFLKMAARIESKRLDKVAKGESEYDNRLEEQLSFIARNVLKTQLKIDSFFSIYSELQNVSPDLVDRILAETKLSEKERDLLQRLFVPLD